MRSILTLAIVASSILITGCTEMQLASHFWKRGSVNEAEKAPYGYNGKRKVGNPYQIDGKWYYPISDSHGYKERGIASWYGKDFHAKATANGETYNMFMLTAAHKTLPLPTWVKVTNLENGKSVVVRVNDRGPFVKNRLIDLSYAAASKLGIVEKGTTPVEVEAMPDRYSIPPSQIRTASYKPATTKEAPIVHKNSGFTTRISNKDSSNDDVEFMDDSLSLAETSAVEIKSEEISSVPDVPKQASTAILKSKIFIQTGAFSNLDNANRQKTVLSKIYPQVQTVEVNRNGQILHRVRVGPLSSVAQADEVLQGLVEKGFNTAIVVAD